MVSRHESHASQTVDRHSYTSLSLVRGEALRAPSQPRVLIVSNRLPVTARMDDGVLRVNHSSGGLASGLRGVHEQSRGLWIGWSGIAQTGSDATRGLEASLRQRGHVSVPLDTREIDGFYRRFSNGVLWPALHGRAPAECAAASWSTYESVNRRYAEIIAQNARAGDSVWIHDYHLMLVPRLLRGRRPDVRIGFFLHTPFPTLASFSRVPHFDSLIDGLLGADVVAFHTADYVRNFMNAVRLTSPNEVRADRVEMADRDVTVFACPIGIDFERFRSVAGSSEVVEASTRIRTTGTWPLFVGVDRLDYTKGIPQRLRAFEQLLVSRPGLRGAARLIQIAVPSREDAAGYSEIREETETLVRAINGRFGTMSWRPIEYMHGSVDMSQLVALYRAADVMLVTPLCDGMNLVAKEFVASRVDGDGVLVLSERAGAAAELRGALPVDPRNVAGLARACEAALEMSPTERRVRMRRMRAVVASNDVFRWSSSFLDALRA